MSEILAAAKRATNADLIVECHQLGYLRDDDRVLDPTYGLGTFWRDWRPADLVACDLNPAKSPLGVSVDFTALPWEDEAFDAVVFDPPYKLCLDEHTEILTRRGWLTYDQVLVGDHTYSIDPATGTGTWQAITEIHIHDDGPTEVIVAEGKNLDFVATPNHWWLVANQNGRLRWKQTSELTAADRIPHAATWADAPTIPTHSDELVELVGWFWTEGHLEQGSTYGHITQSRAVNADYCDRIERCLRTMFGPPVPRFERVGRGAAAAAWRIKDEDRNRRFIFSAPIGALLATHAPSRVPTMQFLESLTAPQLRLFVEVSLAADGTASGRLTQARPEQAHAFELACTLAGVPYSIAHRDDGNGHVVHTKRRSWTKPLRAGLHVETRDTVMWCVTVKHTSTWLARRNGRVYFTGNSGTATASVDDRYGVDGYMPIAERHQLILDGLAECVRVLKVGGRLLVKVQDQVASGRVWWQTDLVTRAAEERGCRKVDALLFLGGRSQPKGRRQVHARRNYSTLLVFVKESAS